MTFKEYRDLLRIDRSIRRFMHDRPVTQAMLTDLVALTRYCASGRNAQPLKYLVITDEERCSMIFPTLKWAGYYKEWDGPSAEERPVGYLVQCQDTDIAPTLLCDDGLQLQAITLGARTLGLGCCIIKAFNAAEVSRLFNLPDNLRPIYVLAIGYPAEEVRLTDIGSDGDFRYYRDGETQCVPKRSLDELIIG